MNRIIIDGSYGEGGGQILRTALALSIMTGYPFRIERIRALRRNPGLAAQHLTAVCSAAGDYGFDVGLAREDGSAGAVILVLQTVLLPLARAAADSRLLLRGGMHMARSPPFDYVRDVWLSMLARLGIEAAVELAAWGWYPVGKGEVCTQIRAAPAPLKPIAESGPIARRSG
jgi:RNA 3'-terminal phosphate cyclase (ATP)